MKAIVLKGFGGVENLVVEEIPVPQPNDHEVLVRVVAAAVNPIDIKTRKGKGVSGILKEFNPIILGWDISGTVVRRGKNVTTFSEGDDVFGMINFPGHGRAYAEFAAAPSSHLALKPSGISHEEASGASLAALTAWQLLKYRSGIGKGSTVLIHAAAGGVGHFAVQMAKHLGAIVAATASAANHRFVIDLGATQHINYEKDRFEQVLHNIDFVIDAVGNDYIDRSLEVLKPGGTIISIPSGASEDVVEKAAARGMNGYNFRTSSSGEDMTEIAGMLEKGELKSVISRIYSLSEVRDAHLQIESGKTRGKIVIRM
jgi:NADPH:quinone reductase-like Zn-dependent oxidoreductase